MTDPPTFRRFVVCMLHLFVIFKYNMGDARRQEVLSRPLIVVLLPDLLHCDHRVIGGIKQRDKGAGFG